MSNAVDQMFGRIAGVYDLLNHVLSMGIDRSWRKRLAALVPSQSSILLDLAAGTLDVAIALHKTHPDANIFAMDFCQPMLERGLPKLKDEALRRLIVPCAADALRLPLPDSCIDAITIAFGIRNIQPRIQAFAEMKRVLKPGGIVCVLEFGSARERIWLGLYNFYLTSILPHIGQLLSRDHKAYEYLATTIKNFPAAPFLAEEMETAGLVNAQFCKLTGGIVCLHWAKKAVTEPIVAKEE